MKKPVKKTTKAKLTKFDKDAIELMRQGTRSTGRLSALLGIDTTQVRNRMLELEKSGLVAFDATEPDKISLTIKAYNELKLSPLVQKTEKPPEKQEAKLVGEKASQILQPPSTQQTPQLQQPEVHAKTREHIDLAELLRRGAPKDPFYVKREGTEEKVVIEEHKLDEKTADLLKKTIDEYEGEKCDLCRGEFKLAISGGHPKYGHCFCGAAYHQDCYESLLDDTKSCVRCGRTLEIVLDRRSEDAVRAIRKLFE